MPLTKRTMRTIVISYGTAAAIILILLFSAQIIIQLALMQEQHNRYVASQINQQEIRTRRMYRNAINLQNPAPGLDYKKITKDLETDAVAWEETQNAMYVGGTSLGLNPSDFSDGSVQALNKGKPHYIVMRDALHRIFLAEDKEEKGASPDIVRNDVGIFFNAEPIFFQSLIDTYDSFAKQADQQVVNVRFTEIILCALTFLVLCAEALFVIRPAMIYLNNHLRLITSMSGLSGMQTDK